MMVSFYQSFFIFLEIFTITILYDTVNYKICEEIITLYILTILGKSSVKCKHVALLHLFQSSVILILLTLVILFVKSRRTICECFEFRVIMYVLIACVDTPDSRWEIITDRLVIPFIIIVCKSLARYQLTFFIGDGYESI